MTGMPYALEVGALFNAIADTYNAMGVSDRQAALDDLYTKQDFIDLAYFPGDSKAAGAVSKTPFPKDLDDLFQPAPDREQKRVDHMKNDWLGDPTLKKPTGWWSAWRGDTKGIIRETLIRALEVSLGYDHNQRGYVDAGGGARKLGTTSVLPGGAKPWPAERRRWELEFLWTCGSPRFDGWVYWRQSRGKVVTVVFTTPGPQTPAGDSKLSLKLTDPSPLINPSNDYKSPAIGSRHATGLWVVGHEEVKNVPAKTFFSAFERLGKFVQEIASLGAAAYVDGTGSPIVAVQPSVYDGGVDPAWS